jgi:peptidyl-tRNA hydrolase, PTH1 family
MNMLGQYRKGEFMRFLFGHKEKSEEPSTPPYLIVGLGNPGVEYRSNRHNVGFMVIDRLANDMSVKLGKYQFKAQIGSQIQEGQKWILAKPQTFMNLSGIAVGSLVKFYKVPMEHLMIIHDDIDLPIGTIRIRPKGGSAGQNGVNSIIERLSTQDFPRLRVGIGRPSGQRSAANYVLADFQKSEKAIVDELLDRCAEALKTFVHSGLDTAMNRYNGEIDKE